MQEPDGDALIEVEIVYALPERQELLRLSLAEGATVQAAIEASGLLEKYPELDPGGRNKLGIFARLTRADAVLRHRDRIEIYRPLIADPKEVRKQRAEAGKATRRGGAA